MDCLFCKIANKEIPSKKVYEDEFCYAFEDIAPAAPVHILFIPKEHISGMGGITPEDYADLEKMGLEALYTPELLEAMSEADPENLEIQDWKAVMGDPEGACVVLGKDENGLTGITEFRYSR